MTVSKTRDISTERLSFRAEFGVLEKRGNQPECLGAACLYAWGQSLLGMIITKNWENVTRKGVGSSVSFKQI